MYFSYLFLFKNQKSIFIFAEINLTTRGPLYTCLVLCYLCEISWRQIFAICVNELYRADTLNALLGNLGLVSRKSFSWFWFVNKILFSSFAVWSVQVLFSSFILCIIPRLHQCGEANEYQFFLDEFSITFLNVSSSDLLPEK